MKRIAAILASIAVLAACDDSEIRTEFASSDEIRLEVGGTTVFRYDPLTCQLGFNGAENQFRVHKDDMSDFFSLKLSRLPSAAAEIVTGDISWTTSSDLASKKNVTFETLKVEGDVIWLWNRGSRIAVAVRTLN